MREKITVSAFSTVLLAFFTLVMILPGDKEASVKENRELASMPEFSAENIFSGKFCSEYEEYLSDNVAFRSTLTDIGAKIEDMQGIQSEETGRIVTLPGASSLVLNDGKIMEVFKNNPVVAKDYTDTLNMYSEEFSDKADIYLMLVPTQIEFDTSSYRLLADNQSETISEVYSGLKNIRTVDVYSELKDHADEYIYFRTDHHWTQRGAYYGYTSFAKEKGLSPVPLGDMKCKSVGGFLGYLYNQANAEEYSKYADDIEYFEYGKNYSVKIEGEENGKPYAYSLNMYNPPAENTAVNYGLFMGSDHQLATVHTDNKGKGTALVIKDSYANAIIPLLTNHYEKIIVVDPRYFKGTVTELFKEHDIDDIIFINYTMTTTMPAFVQFIRDIK